ncbi:MAG: hypothetical protein LBR34_06015 [Prevotella sp.]|jgi:hypothetical protein|nr:hypothetical protein [Prevotella sp.]
MKNLIKIIIGSILIAAYSTGVSADSLFDDQSMEQLPGSRLPSEQSMAEIQQMCEFGEYDGRDLRDKPGVGPGLGELPVCLDSRTSNVLALAAMGLAYVSLKKRNKRNK